MAFQRAGFQDNAFQMGAVIALLTALVVAQEPGYYDNKYRLTGDVFEIAYVASLPFWVAPYATSPVPPEPVAYSTTEREVREQVQNTDHADQVLNGLVGARVRRHGRWVQQ